MSRFERGPSQSRVMTWSFAVHVGAVVIMFVVPREWLVRPRETPVLMTISLGGNAAVRTTGTNLIGGRTIEQVAPPPKRPEPVKPTPKPPPAPAVTKAPSAPAARASTPKPDVPAARAPVTGPQVTRGNTAVDTGARGQGSGLKFEPGSGGGETDLKDFCCPEYLRNLLATIDSHWDRTTVGLRGTTIVRFEVLRSGQIIDAKVSTSSGSDQLDRLARRALANARLSPLPAEYTDERLIINLAFPYGGP